ncbi:MAG TPA: TMEM175 family protein [Methanoregula sp.]|nr:TMEM175 family protein [Methanoregula sp.]
MEYHISKIRLETMVDGIFAIAMTLLVLGITPPKPAESQAQAILPGMIFDLIPEIFIFIIAFLILASFWLNHHRHFHFVRSVDSRLLWINIFLLISIVFIPFSTDLAGDYPDVQIAVLLFHINILIVGLFFAYQVSYISKSEHLCDPETDRNFLQSHYLRSMLIPAVSFGAVIISFVNPSVSLMVYLVIPVGLYFLIRSGS